jgi:membrane associated rhomboid family serine protease
MSLFERSYAREPARTRGRSPLAQWLGLSATTQLIALNVVVFVLWQFFGAEDWFADNFTCSASQVFEHGKVWTLLTAAFSHEYLFHIFVNMMCFWFSARAVELRLGKRQTYAIYIAAAVVASLVSILGYSIGGNPAQRELGASGAVMAFLVMYACYFPRSVILIWGILPLPAAAMVILYIVLDFAGAVRSNPNDHVAHVAHLAGAAVGLVWWIGPWRKLAFGKHPADRWQSARAADSWESGPFAPRPRDDARLDAILDKVHREGIQSLTDAEREELRRASEARRAP